jgi:prevent-host-death family protein
MSWQVQEAKQRFSELVRRAQDEGPQIVTRHGEEIVVVVAVDEYRRATGATADFKDFLTAAPDLGQLQFERSTEPAPVVDLGSTGR